jgi:DNA-binding MarR family transcriptional regulator
MADEGLIELATRLHAAALHLLRRLRVEDDALGLTAPRASALSVLVFGGARTMGELAAAEQVRVPTMSRLVRGLEADGLVRRESDAGDGRVVWLHATAAARRLLRRGRARRVRALTGALKQLDATAAHDLAAGVAVMERLVAAGRGQRSGRGDG